MGYICYMNNAYIIAMPKFLDKDCYKTPITETNIYFILSQVTLIRQRKPFFSVTFQYIFLIVRFIEFSEVCSSHLLNCWRESKAITSCQGFVIRLVIHCVVSSHLFSLWICCCCTPHMSLPAWWNFQFLIFPSGNLGSKLVEYKEEMYITSDCGKTWRQVHHVLSCFFFLLPLCTPSTAPLRTSSTLSPRETYTCLVFINLKLHQRMVQ